VTGKPQQTAMVVRPAARPPATTPLRASTSLSPHFSSAPSASSDDWASAHPATPAGFFSHHGIWAPGVRMFRAMKFASKAYVISAAFLIPIATLAWFFFSTTAESIAFSAKERLGVAYARDAMPLLRAATAHRLHAVASADAPAPELADARAKVEAAFAKLSATDKALGTELGTGKAFAALQAAAAARDQAKGDGAAQFAAHTTYINALLDLLGQSTDGSNLTLDPDVDSYYLMDAALFRLPYIIEGSAQSRGLGAAAIASAKLTPEMQRLLSDKVPVLEFQFDQMVAGLAKALAYNTALAAAVKVQDVQDNTNAYLKLIRTNFFGAEGAEVVKGDRAVYLTSANKALDSQYEATERMLTSLDGLLDARVSKMATNRNWVGGCALFFVLVAGYLFYAFALVTRGGFAELRRHLKAMTSGDLTTSPSPWGSDEAARMMVTMAEMQTSLRALVSEVRASSEEIVTAATQVSTGALELSTRTEKAAASLEETASAMEEISSTVRNTADNVREADALGRQNATVATEGGKVINDAVSTMREIQASSSKIGDIIGVIDSIAFQTNILALNAAVEAARAGEQGRGFAVVATEVRALAQRSATAAKEIKGLIADSTARVESGTKVVSGAGTTMTQLVDNANRMSGLLADISTAANEQNKGVAEVGKTVTHLDADTQQNAALVEQTSAAADSLKGQAISLAEQVARFRLPGRA